MASRMVAGSGLMAFLAVGVAGCSIKTAHLNASQWPITQRAMYYSEPAPYRIGVLPLMDRRPAEERTGKRPRGLFLLLWNRRVGDYYTGDHIFGNDVAKRLTDQLTEYLRSSHAFAEVIQVHPPADFNPANAASVSRVGRERVVDYMLQGELQHFFGSQSQHTSIVLLPLYFINTYSWQDSKSLPWGKTEALFALYDGRSGDMVWRRLIAADQTLPRDTDSMAEAALESFADTTGTLTTNLRELPLGNLQVANE